MNKGGVPVKIKSLDELKKVRDDAMDKVNLRKHGMSDTDYTEILIGMATCGISAGARETLNAFVSQLASKEEQSVKVIPVGCIGYCHSEPTVQVNVPGKKPVFYGKVKEDKVGKIIEQHIIGGNPVEEYQIDVDFERA